MRRPGGVRVRRPFPVASARVRAVSVARMQAIDETAIHTFGIPRLLLMEHAGLALARAVAARLRRAPGSVVVCCGSGYNGGDGLAAARHLHDWGVALRVILTGAADRLRAEPALYARILRRVGVTLQELDESAARAHIEGWLAHAALIVDALLGIGVTGAVRDPARGLIELMNRSGRPIVAADVPSGLNADTGAVQGVAVRATTTVTFGLPKQGCLRGEGPAHTGRLIVDPITIPRAVLVRR